MTTAPVPSINDEQLAELERKAQAATTGPWEELDESLEGCVGADEYIICEHAGDDACFIAAANPATVLALIAAVRQQREELERLRDASAGMPAGWRELISSISSEADRYDDAPGVHIDDSVELWQLPNARTALTVGHLRKARAIHVTAPAAPAPAAQEPVTWMGEGGNIEYSYKQWMTYGWAPLYTAPPAAEQPGMTHCACGDAYPSTSYDAGFIAGSGMCQNCDAAIPAKDVATKSEQPDTKAARDVLAERRRQVDAEGFDAGHDDMASRGQLAVAAGYYALSCGYPHERDIGCGRVPDYWPWDKSWWKPLDARSNLVRAGALIMAEIDRLDRALLGKDGEA